MLEFFGDLWAFLRDRKKWWLAPVIICLVVIGLLIVVAANSALMPFVYTLF
jgi:hypothetical protein